MKKKIYIWCSDNNRNSGEGILANKFISDLKKININFKYIIKSSKNHKFYFLRKILGINFERLIVPISGVIYLWFIYISKKNKKLCYVNYLPLWNFLIFLLLPPKTILGPVTGGSRFLKKPLINYIIRNYILNFFFKISEFIIKYRYEKILFSTNLLENNNSKKANFYYNYVLKDIKFKKNFKKRKYDLIFYLRKHSNKNTDLQVLLANKLASKFKVITVGNKIDNKLIKNLGYISRKNLKNKLKETKFAFLSTENLTSFFSLDCFEASTYIIYDYRINQKKYLLDCSFAINYSNFKSLLKKIDNLIKKYKPPKKFSIKKLNDFDNYLKI